jgi:protein-disulfide isomerase
VACMTIGEPIQLPAVIVYGDAEAPHTLDIYEDMRCSYCAQLEHELGATMKSLADRGTYRIAYHVANFLDRGNARGGSTNSLAALGAAAAQDVSQFAALRVALLDYRRKHGSEGLADLDVIRGIVAQTPGVDFLAVSKAINEDRFREWALETGPASLAALRAAWEAADLPGRAGTPAAFVDGKAIEVFTEVDDVVEVVGAEEFEGLVKAALA